MYIYMWYNPTSSVLYTLKSIVCMAESDVMFLSGSGSRWGLSRTSRKTVSPVFEVFWNWRKNWKVLVQIFLLPLASSAWSHQQASWSSPCSPPSLSHSPRRRPSSPPPPAGSSFSSPPSAWKLLPGLPQCQPPLQKPPSQGPCAVVIGEKKTLKYLSKWFKKPSFSQISFKIPPKKCITFNIKQKSPEYKERQKWKKYSNSK